MLINLLIILISLAILIFTVNSKYKIWITMAIIAVGSIISCYEAVKVIATNNTYNLGKTNNFILGEGYMSIDLLSAIFMIIVSCVAISVAIYACGYFKTHLESKSKIQLSLHCFSLVALYFAMIGALASQDIYRFLICWELMTISSFLLIIFDAQNSEIRKNALNYLVLMHIGFIALVVAFSTIMTEVQPATFDSLKSYFDNNNPIPIFSIFLLGFGIKAGIFPLHIWLPKTYSAAPSHVSAFMSGAMKTVGIYGVLRVLSYINTELMTIGIALFIIGIITGVWGVLLSTMQRDTKRFLAYSSMENVGIIFLAIGVSLIGKASGNNFMAICAMTGAIMQLISHSAFKTLLFFSVGNICTQAKSTNMEKLGGLAKKMPMTAMLTMICLVVACGLPPLCGFISEFMIYYGLFDTIAMQGNNVIIAICGLVAMAFIGGVVILAYTKFYSIIFLGNSRVHSHDKIVDVGTARTIAFTIPLIFIVAIGFMPATFFQIITPISETIIGQVAHVTDMNSVVISLNNVRLVSIVMVMIIIALYILKTQMLKKRVVTESPTWGCGFTAPTERMQYSGESFSEGLQAISPSISKDKIEEDKIERDEIFPNEHSVKIEHKDRIDTLFTQWWVALIHKINKKVMTIKTNRVNYYILYALLFFVVIFLLTIFNLM